MKQYHWTTTTKYVDIDSGEQITETNAKQNYIIIKTTKDVELNQILQKGNIHYTKQCRRNPQTKLQFTDH